MVERRLADAGDVSLILGPKISHAVSTVLTERTTRLLQRGRPAGALATPEIFELLFR